MAQTNEEELVNQQLWIDIYPHFYVNDKLEYYGDAGYRTILEEFSWSRIYARPSVRYHFNKLWQAHAGLGFFYIFNKSNADRFEITPWQGVQLNWPKFNRLSFKNLVKLEERISYRTDDWSSSFDLRLRYKLSGTLKLCKTCTESYWFIPFYGELFFPVNDDIEEFFRNRGRAGLGLAYNVSKTWQFSFIFNWQSSRSGPEDGLAVSDYAYQLKIRKLWNKRLIKINNK